MALRVLSFEFFQALGTADGRGEGVTGVDDLDAMFLLEMGETVVTVELEGTAYIGFARGGNPNDVDFQLSAPEEVWAELFRSGAGGDVGSWVGEGGKIELETMDPQGEQVYRRALPVIEDLFARAKQLDVDPA